jgi:hypothetical protein
MRKERGKEGVDPIYWNGFEDRQKLILSLL